MTDLRKAAEMALESLEFFFSQAHPEVVDLMYGNDWARIAKERTESLRQALAQPEQKQWQNLTDDEIKEIVGPWGDTPIKGYTRKLFDQIEAKLKEKNT